MKAAYFDCFSGVSGDMTLGALLDCGADAEQLRRDLAGLPVHDYELVVRRVRREGIAATDVDVRLLQQDTGHGRHLSDIEALLAESALPESVRRSALAIFTRLADAEAKVHGTDRESIHFHEVGAVDAIVDIVGSCLLLDQLGVERVFTSSFPCGHGTITCQHGVMPVPAPATLELLRGFPVRPVDIRGELVTPTGAAIVTTLATSKTAGPLPAMRITAAGFGAGKKQFLPEMPNLLRVVLGEVEAGPAAESGTPQTVAVLETNLDDLSPEAFALAMERCFAAGAVDVFFSPIQMKKSRPGTLVTVLCPPERAEAIAVVLFRETGTFGVRVREQARFTLDRDWQTVSTPYGEIRLKVGRWRGETMTVAPEYEDCRNAAVAHDVPLRRVYDAALATGGVDRL